MQSCRTLHSGRKVVRTGTLPSATGALESCTNEQFRPTQDASDSVRLASPALRNVLQEKSRMTLRYAMLIGYSRVSTHDHGWWKK
jgi:hypothetical protein